MNVLFINSRVKECGVHQFGLNLARVLGATRAEVGGPKSEDGCYRYCEPATDDELLAAISAYSADILLYNFYPCTMQWVTLQTLNKVRTLGLKQVTIFHETPVTGFDAFIYPDPTFAATSRQLNDWFPIGRPLPIAAKEVPNPKRQIPGKNEAQRKKKGKTAGGTPAATPERIPIIGSAGFGFGWKGHVRLVERVVAEFEKAKIRLHLPFAKFGDADGIQAKAIAEQCRRRRAFSNIELAISHDFMEPDQFVEWLAGNDLNAFLYDDTDRSRGIASTIDHALAARRPIAVTRSWMFRHLWDVEGIFVEDSPLSAIMARGIEPLRPIYERFADEKVRRQIEHALEEVAVRRAIKWNRVLDDIDRQMIAAPLEEMARVAPEMMARKIPEANVQQAWMLSAVRATAAKKILCVGCFEDTAYEALLAANRVDESKQTYIAGIDPAIVGSVDLHTFASSPERGEPKYFDCIFATSVIEHVEDDEQFIRDICLLLKPDGVALLTCDFKADYKSATADSSGGEPGDPLPATVKRFYTAADYERLGKVMEQQACYWLDRPQLDGAPDFVYQGHHYSFATMVIKHL